jgi:Tetratricopeptide repeat.
LRANSFWKGTIDRALIAPLAVALVLICSAELNGICAKSGAANEHSSSKSRSAKVDAQELISRCESLRRQNRAQEALVALDSALASQPGSAELYKTRSACYLDLGNLEKAEADIDRAVKKAKKSQVESYARQYSLLSESYRKKLEPEKMRAALDKYVRATHSVDAFCARAQFYRIRGDITAALKDLDAAIALEPKDTKALEQKALTAFKARRHRAAIDAYTSLINIYSTRPEAERPNHVWSGRGYCYNYLGEHEKAIADLNVAAQKGFDRRALLRRANSLEALGKYDQALKDAETILKHEPSNVTAVDLKVALLERLGKHDEALVQVNSLIARYPSSANWYRRRAAIFKASGKTAEAKQDLSKAQKLESLVD